MTRADMEAESCAYRALLERAREAIRSGLHAQALEAAQSSFKHIDGMMQYERKYADAEFVSVETIDIVLKYAPLFFHFQSLDALEILLKDERRIEKNTSEDLGEKLATARTLMWDAHRLWDHLERHESLRQDELRATFGGDQNRWRLLAELLGEMELVRRIPDGGSYRLSLVTRLDELTVAKCSSCGFAGRAQKSRFLAELLCPKCKRPGFFVILPPKLPPGMKE